MNKIIIKNSYYTQKVEILINGENVSQYSKLAGITCVNLFQYVSNVVSYLDNEVFDDYEIDFYGYRFICELIRRNAECSEYCKGVNYYPIDTIDTPDNVLTTLREMAKEHNVELHKNLEFTVYSDAQEVKWEEKEYIRKTDSLPSDIGIFNKSDEKNHLECKFSVAINDDISMDSENILNIAREYVGEFFEYYYIYHLFVPVFEEYVTALKYQNLSERELVLLNAIQSNEEKYYLGKVPETIDLLDIITIDFVAFPKNAYKIEISDEAKLKPEENKWKAISGGQVKITVLNQNNDVCEEHIMNIIEHQYATSIKIVPRFEYLKINEKNYIDIVVEPVNAEDKDNLQFEISDSSIARYENGQVIALKDGSTVLTVKGKNCQETLTINVKAALKQITLEHSGLVLRGGTTTILECSVSPQNAETENLIWEIDNGNIAAINPSRDKMKCQINASGTYTGKGNIRCYDQKTGIGAICNIEVISKIKHTLVGTMALMCMLVGFLLPVLSVASIGLSVYGLVKDEESSHNTRYVVCMVISVLTIIIWAGSQ